MSARPSSARSWRCTTSPLTIATRRASYRSTRSATPWRSPTTARPACPSTRDCRGFSPSTSASSLCRRRSSGASETLSRRIRASSRTCSSSATTSSRPRSRTPRGRPAPGRPKATSVEKVAKTSGKIRSAPASAGIARSTTSGVCATAARCKTRWCCRRSSRGLILWRTAKTSAGSRPKKWAPQNTSSSTPSRSARGGRTESSPEATACAYFKATSAARAATSAACSCHRQCSRRTTARR
mmetsp:Transcript_3395/g.10271  ORF Transcript_3395/g.10271 Transcript_3395/m.10271 type:complete len:240 (+) Transcript_3395:667-1386(+)